MKIKASLLLLFLSLQLSAGWEVFSPEGQTANCISFYVDDHNHWLVGSGNILLYDLNTQGWSSYFAICPVQDAAYMAGEMIMVALSCGPWSMEDGIHYLDPSSGTVYALKYLSVPRFIQYDADIGRFWVGYREGMAYSDDISQWEDLTYFNGKNIYDMAMNGPYYVVSEGGINYGLYVSADRGASWVNIPGAPMFSDLEYDYNGKVYGVFPGESYSSGLWSSNDNGLTWAVEFWATHMQCVGCDPFGHVYVGFDADAYIPNVGIARWDSLNQQLIFMNEGLASLSINQITCNPGMSAPHLFCCTDSGAYLNLNPVRLEEPVSASAPLQLWPNPARDILHIEHHMSGNLHIGIYNSAGKHIESIVPEEESEVVAYACQGLDSGVYIIVLENGVRRISGKWIKR